MMHVRTIEPLLSSNMTMFFGPVAAAIYHGRCLGSYLEHCVESRQEGLPGKDLKTPEAVPKYTQALTIFSFHNAFSTCVVQLFVILFVLNAGNMLAEW